MVGASVLACSAPPAPARVVAHSPERAPVATVTPPVGAPWPDVAREARSDKSGARDAALIVAVQRRGTLPHLPGARVSGEAWARFLPSVLGVPTERVTTLFDAAATPTAIAAALRGTAARVAPGARLWFVAVGYVQVNEWDLPSTLAASEAQLISVLDVSPEDARKLSWMTLAPVRARAIPPTTFSIMGPTALPGGSHSALSYLLMGALRGWGDGDHDNRVTALEAAAYVDLTLRLLAPSGTSPPRASVSEDLACSELTTLSVAREPAPNVLEIVPGAGLGSVATPEPTYGMAGPNHRPRLLYGRAEQEVDEVPARCAWSAVAEGYAHSWRSDSAQLSQVEAALNGAYALHKLGRTDEAAALYRSYLNEHGAARTGEDPKSANERQAYAVSACASYRALAKAEHRHAPGYFASCRNVRCTADRAACATQAANAEVQRLGASSAETSGARLLSLAARDREELAGWEPTEAARVTRLREASERYAAAEAAWAALLKGGNAPDPAEAARFLAEATVRRLTLQLATGVEVSEKDAANARQLARQARDLTHDERRAEPARLLVEFADAFSARKPSPVAQGDLPLPVAAALEARDEFLASVPATFDAAQLRYRMAYEAGQLLLRYGHLAEARQRLELPYSLKCGVSPVAHEAWVLLLSIANQEADVARALSLAADNAICPSDAESRVHAERLRKPVRSIPFVLEARRQLQASQALPNGAERSALRREAAASFRQFVLEAPDRDEAPDATLRAAELYAELDQRALALEMYRRFVDRYGSGDGAHAPDLERAYAELVMLHTQLGDYRAAARALIEQSKQKRLPATLRAAAGRKARELRRDRDARGL